MVVDTAFCNAGSAAPPVLRYLRDSCTGNIRSPLLLRFFFNPTNIYLQTTLLWLIAVSRSIIVAAVGLPIPKVDDGNVSGSGNNSPHRASLPLPGKYVAPFSKHFHVSAKIGKGNMYLPKFSAFSPVWGSQFSTYIFSLPHRKINSAG